jgi:hypothetical protein
MNISRPGSTGPVLERARPCSPRPVNPEGKNAILIKGIASNEIPRSSFEFASKAVIAPDTTTCRKAPSCFEFGLMLMVYRADLSNLVGIGGVL